MGILCNLYKLYFRNDPCNHDQPERYKGKGILEILFVLSCAVPMFVSLLIMRTMLQPEGAVNVLLRNLGGSRRMQVSRFSQIRPGRE